MPLFALMFFIINFVVCDKFIYSLINSPSSVMSLDGFLFLMRSVEDQRKIGTQVTLTCLVAVPV